MALDFNARHPYKGTGRGTAIRAGRRRTRLYRSGFNAGWLVIHTTGTGTALVTYVRQKHVSATQEGGGGRGFVL